MLLHLNIVKANTVKNKQMKNKVSNTCKHVQSVYNQLVARSLNATQKMNQHHEYMTVNFKTVSQNKNIAVFQSINTFLDP